MQGHPPGSINVQIYRLIKEWTAWDIARRAGFAFFGIFAGTEENPDFMKSMLGATIPCLYISFIVLLNNFQHWNRLKHFLYANSCGVENR